MSDQGSTWWPDRNSYRPSFGFVDADNMKMGLSQALIRRGVDDVDHECFRLDTIFAQSYSDRYYVFGAVEEGHEPEEWIKALRASPRFIFRSGLLQVTGGRRKQHGVDVMLAVEALKCAHSRTMRSCTVFSGDGDMLPLIGALVDLGIITTVVSFDNPDKSSVASSLRDAADDFVQIGSRILVNSLSYIHGVRSRGSRDQDGLVSSGKIGRLNEGVDSPEIVTHVDGTVTVSEMPESILTYNRNTMIQHTTLGSLRGALLWNLLVGKGRI